MSVRTTYVRRYMMYVHILYMYVCVRDVCMCGDRRSFENIPKIQMGLCFTCPNKDDDEEASSPSDFEVSTPKNKTSHVHRKLSKTVR
jgi:hypothetical protein